jgi:hypothetical protein
VSRYVILEHTGTPSFKPGRHWDLMLEADGRLRTWELPATPQPRVGLQALPLADHRLDYLDYEGPLSNDRGTVRRWDFGEYQVLSETEFELKIQVCGQHLQGRLFLARRNDQTGLWLVEFNPAPPK